jgi:DNA polymerase-3 subunit beta
MGDLDLESDSFPKKNLHDWGRPERMKAKASRKNLYEGVQIALRAVTGRSSLPILSNVYMKAHSDGSGDDKSKLTLIATDLEMGIECAVPAEIEEEGAATVPARAVSEILASMPDSQVVLKTDDGALKLTCESSDYKINGLPPDEFPLLPEVDGNARFTIPQPALRQMIRQTIYAVSSDDTRPILTGVLIVLKDNVLKMVATDTHRLCVKTVELSGAEGEAYAIVPSRAMSELLRILSGDEEKKVTVSISENQASFDTDGVHLVSRLIEGQFPSFDRVIPTEHNRKLTLQVDPFQQGVKRASIVAREDANKIVLSTGSEKLTITSESAMLGRAHEEVDLLREGDDIEIAFNARYILDTLGAVESEGIEFRLQGPLNPGVLKPTDSEDYICVVMPMQISPD